MSGGETRARGDAETAGVHAFPAEAALASRSDRDIGRYVPLGLIGRGGMGRVLRAYDPKLQREVALKEVRRDALDASSTRRLVAEARAMAKLSHPNVVSVYDVETLPSGEVVLVMEFVAGQSLLQWLSEEPPRGDLGSMQSIVQRFIAAGRGLRAAHAVGLLHRDFKPANVLVADDATSSTGTRGVGTVKVTDFGLATRGSPSATDTLCRDGGASESDSSSGLNSIRPTETGFVMGTPRYMAPEQHRGRMLTPAADQYAFCVALWEALCGAPPFSGAGMVRSKEKGPPPWPQATTPRPIVDAIVRGLRPDPEDRWPSMDALLDALEWDPQGRRNRWLLAGGGVAVLGTVGLATFAFAAAPADRCAGAEQGLAGIWDEARRSEVEASILAVDRSYSPLVFEHVARSLDAYRGQWVRMHTDACEATSVRGEQSTAVLDLRMACLHRAAIDLRATVDTLSDADVSVVRNAHELTARLPAVSRCADVAALSADVEPPRAEEADAVEAIRDRLAQAHALRAAGRYDPAQAAVDAAEALAQSVAYGPIRTELALQRGTVLASRGKYQEAEAALTEALELASRWRQLDAMYEASVELLYVVGYDQQRMEGGLRYLSLATGLAHGNPMREAAVLDRHASILANQGKYAEAERKHRAALALIEQTRGPDDPQIAPSRNNIANALRQQGKYAEAEVEYRAALDARIRTLGSEHPEVAESRNNLGMVLSSQGRREEAQAEFEVALALRVKTLGPDHPDVAQSRSNLARNLTAQGKYEDAEEHFLAALRLRERVLGAEHPVVAESRSDYSIILRHLGKYEEAEREVRAALVQLEQAHGPDHPYVALAHDNLGSILHGRLRPVEAEQEFRLALELLAKSLGPDHPHLGARQVNLAGVLATQGKFDEAEVQLRAALPALEKDLGPDHPHVAAARHNLAQALLLQGHPHDALPLAELAWVRARRTDIPAQHRARTAFTLARALWLVHADGPERARAHRLATDALGWYRESSEGLVAQGGDVAEVEEWLETHRVP